MYRSFRIDDMNNSRKSCMPPAASLQFAGCLGGRLAALLAPGWRRPASRAARRRGRRGTAAIEFALASPLMLTMIGGLFDFGHAEYARIALASAVSAGAEYAVLTGSGVSSTAIRSVVQSASALDGASLTVSVSAPHYDCIGGSTPTLTTAAAGATCADGSPAGSYVTISAQYSVNALLKAFTPSNAMTLTESATVRLS